MNKKEFQEKKEALVSQINALKKEKEALEVAWVKQNSAIPIGTKVRIKDDGRIGFVASYSMEFSNTEVYIKLNKCKKDGTQANMSMGCWSLKVEDVEVME
jgi:hypothetical protein